MCLQYYQSDDSRHSHQRTNESQILFQPLLGILPVKVCRKEQLRDQSCIENELARRQLAVKDPTDKNWFSSIRNILNSYLRTFHRHMNSQNSQSTPYKGAVENSSKIPIT